MEEKKLKRTFTEEFKKETIRLAKGNLPAYKKLKKINEKNSYYPLPKCLELGSQLSSFL